jgi:hypothetical protein
MKRQKQMIPRAANLLIREHRSDAEIVAAQRADEMLERGDRDGQLVSLITRAQVSNRPPFPGGKNWPGLSRPGGTYQPGQLTRENEGSVLRVGFACAFCTPLLHA